MSDPTSHDEPTEVRAGSAAMSRVPVQVAAPARTGWIAPVALVIALLAAAAAGWALFRPAPDTSTATNAATKSDDPKATVCKAFKTVSDAVYIQTNKAPGPDLGPATPAAVEAIAANARLAMAGGANYLLDNLPSNTPDELAGPIRSFAGQLNSIAMNLLAGIPNDRPEQAYLLHSAEESNKKLAELCK